MSLAPAQRTQLLLEHSIPEGDISLEFHDPDMTSPRSAVDDTDMDQLDSTAELDEQASILVHGSEPSVAVPGSEPSVEDSAPSRPEARPEGRGAMEKRATAALLAA